ncbi:MAG: hypothetical protein WKF37_13720, partial [Bryobacteraceae bacterium]
MSAFLEIVSRTEPTSNHRESTSVALTTPAQREDIERYRKQARHDSWRFAFATGIECSNPVIAGRKGLSVRRDQLAECQHYTRFNLIPAVRESEPACIALIR